MDSREAWTAVEQGPAFEAGRRRGVEESIEMLRARGREIHAEATNETRRVAGDATLRAAGLLSRELLSKEEQDGP